MTWRCVIWLRRATRRFTCCVLLAIDRRWECCVMDCRSLSGLTLHCQGNHWHCGLWRRVWVMHSTSTLYCHSSIKLWCWKSVRRCKRPTTANSRVGDKPSMCHCWKMTPTSKYYRTALDISDRISSHIIGCLKGRSLRRHPTLGSWRWHSQGESCTTTSWKEVI